MLRLAWTLALIVTGCRDSTIEAPLSAEIAAGRGHHLTTVDGLSFVREDCEKTGGRWHQNLVRCDCVGSEDVFAVSQGCVTLEKLKDFRAHHVDLGLEQMQPVLTRQDGLFTVSVRPNTELAERVRKGVFHASHKSAHILRGVTLPPSGRRVMQAIIFESLDDGERVSRYLTSEQLPWAALDTIFDIDYLAGIKHTPSPATNPSWHQAAISVMGDSPPCSSSYWEAGADCWPACGTISEYRGAGSDLWRVTVDMVAFVPVQRHAVLTRCDGDISVHLLPDGIANHATSTQWSIIGDGRDERALQQTITVATRRGRLVEERVESIGRRAIATVETMLQKPRTAFGVGLAVIEDSIDLTDPAVARMVDRRISSETVSLLRDGSGMAPGKFCPVRNVLQAMGHVSEHGTAVASALTRDLKNARLSLLDASEFYWNRDTGFGRDWARFIQEKDVRVVVISQLYGVELPDAGCKKIFHDLFAGSPETLFVVAAGNSGWSNVNSCAQGLARSFENVINVTGSNQGRTALERKANRGSDTVDLAAPWTNDERYGSGRRFAGTSHAAPWVGNLAAKYWTAFPDAKVAEVKSALFDSCETDHGLDVACGGSMDEGAFMGLIRSRGRHDRGMR